MADIAKYIAEQVGNQLGYVISNENNVDSLKADVKKLEHVRDTIQHSVYAMLLLAFIGKLTSNRLLGLSDVSGLREIPTKLISSLTHLEEFLLGENLYPVAGGGEPNAQIHSKKASLGELRHLHQLKALEITIQDASVLPKDLLIFCQLVMTGKDLGKNQSLRKLKLYRGRTKNVHLDRGVKLLLNNVAELCLTSLNGVRNFLYQLNEERFPQ